MQPPPPQKKPLFFFLYFSTFLEPFRLLVVRFCSSLLILLLRLTLVIFINFRCFVVTFASLCGCQIQFEPVFGQLLLLFDVIFISLWLFCMPSFVILLVMVSFLVRPGATYPATCMPPPAQRLINICVWSVKDRFSFIGSASCSVPEWQQWALAVTLIRDAGSPSITSRAHRQKTPPRNRARALTIFGNM